MPGTIQAGTESYLQLTPPTAIRFGLYIRTTLASALLSIGCVAAHADTCINGTWLLDSNASSGLSRNHSREVDAFQKRSYATGSDAAKKSGDVGAKISPKTGLPGFVFDQSPLDVVVDDGWVTFSSQLQNRRFSTNGAMRQVSLSNLNKANSVIAGWDDHHLIVETTTPHGSYIDEQFSLNPEGELVINLQVSTGLTKPFAFIKVYERKEPLDPKCLAHFRVKPSAAALK
ncbi:Uncharacterised protein [BD1-7 clade bacterium]|uniref:Uncharacterized protein n=1 Tax=BD1-7 clade bacterium TaxID=2029982 RepID=A0A5S9N3N6_9GAMM|nr:Uncharacterised protein [BD1-7 clade bacterium]